MKEQKVELDDNDAPLMDITSMAKVDMGLPTLGLSASALHGKPIYKRSKTKLLRPKDWREKKRQKRLASKESRRRNRR